MTTWERKDTDYVQRHARRFWHGGIPQSAAAAGAWRVAKVLPPQVVVGGADRRAEATIVC